ncbi:MAG: hypothetical protein ACJAZ4_002657 [Neptuniibacter pectenicola]|jgi:hypothetical protein|uniref:hypothetical protein n=1 Tax=Neptuniibacter pectenicola TaxID=1806669 RepID=UPI003ADDB336
MFPKIIVTLFLAVVMTGCSTYSANRYSISVDNVTALKEINGTKLDVGEFTASKPGQTEIMCRGVGPIKTPDGQTFENFIKKALVDELKIAEAYSNSAPITLTGNLDAIDFSSNSGTWNLALTVNSSNGNSLSASENYSYTTSFYGETACNQTAQALMPAVQNLIGKVVQNNEFRKLIQ